MTSSEKPWPELELKHGLLNNRIAPRAFVRASIFGTLDYKGGAHRPAFSEEQPGRLSAMGPYSVHQVGGQRLSQSDADVYFWLLSRAYRKGPPVGDAQLFFTREEAFAELARKRGGKTGTSIEDSLERLRSAEFVFDCVEFRGRLRLLAGYHRSDDDKHYDFVVTIARDVAEFLEYGEWTLLLSKQRNQFAKQPLAKGLHAFYASHDSAFPMLPETIKGLMGRQSRRQDKWRAELVAALAKVKAVTGWHKCELDAKTGLVTVEKLEKTEKANKPRSGSPDRAAEPTAARTICADSPV